MSSDKLRLSVLLADLLWIATALLLACSSRLYAAWHSPPQPFGFEFTCLLIVSVLVWPMLYFWGKLDGFEYGWGVAPVSCWLAIGVFSLSVVLSASAYFINERVSRRLVVWDGLLLYGGFFVIRLLARWLLASLWNVRRMVILGDDRVARELAAKIARHPETRTQVVGFFTLAGQNGYQQHADALHGLSTLDIPEILRRKSVTDLVIAFAQPSSQELANLVSRCRGAGITVSLVSQYYDLYLTRPRFVEVGGIPLLRLDKPAGRTPLVKIKPVMDFLLALVLLALSAPLLAAAAIQLLVRKGRVFQSEWRCGRAGQPFRMYRLAIAGDDPANTWFMRLLFTTSLTELPQLWNVLRGEMSVVGPRPETPEHIKHYSEWHRQRLAFRPGITGWAQVHGSRDKDSSDEKARFDLYYILAWSPLLDLGVLLQTGWTVLSRLRRPAPARRPRISAVPTSAAPRLISERYADSPQSSAN
jgi:lipopolysaccharide/colanic/teichoic acid biosynthesis glycosyltransferase